MTVREYIQALEQLDPEAHVLVPDLNGYGLEDAEFTYDVVVHKNGNNILDSPAGGGVK